VLKDCVGKKIELMLINFTWGLGVDLCTSGLNPIPIGFGDSIVLRFSKLLKSYLDLIVGKGSIFVGIKFLESLSSHIVSKASFSWRFLSFFLSLFFGKMADSEVFKEGVGEKIELMLINFTWSLGVDLCTSGLSPIPIGFGDCIVLRCSKVLDSYLDLIV